MQILREKLKADKLVVAADMDLKEAEAREVLASLRLQYQKELEKIDKRTADLIRRYARSTTPAT